MREDLIERLRREADISARPGQMDRLNALADKFTDALEAMRAEVELLTHKIITCGVAADHPNQNLTRTGAYASKWDSQQAERVRALRARAGRLAEALHLIAAPQRPDGTWNRDREACQQIAEEALRDHDQEGKDG